MQEETLGFIGGGNMTRAIVAGLIDSGANGATIHIAEPGEEQRQRLAAEFPDCRINTSNDQVATAATVLILSVKPQILTAVCRELAEVAGRVKPLIISIAAGVRATDIDAWLGGGHSVVRVMPNQPALLGLGVSGLYANENTSEEQKTVAGNIMSAVGSVVNVDKEGDIDSVTAVSGSGPAYFFLLIKILSDTAVGMGLDPASARELAVKTAVGGAALAERDPASMDELIARVRSPGGTTAAALESLDAAGVQAVFRSAIESARDRAEELADKAHDEGKA